MKTIGVYAPTSKTHAMCAVRPEHGGKAQTRPDAGDCYVSIIISEFSSQRPMHLTHGTQIKSVADVSGLGQELFESVVSRHPDVEKASRRKRRGSRTEKIYDLET